MTKFLSISLLFLLSGVISLRRNYDLAIFSDFDSADFNYFTKNTLNNTSNLRRLDINGADHQITSLPGLNDKLTHYAGHINIDAEKNSNIFYWLFEAPKDSETLPLLVWLNGGPGCSSMDGLWLELGPLRLDPNGKIVKINPHSWHNVANLLFVDQPVGTGFAYTRSQNGYARDDGMVNAQFYRFLSLFFERYPRYLSEPKNGIRKTRSFFMSGESHAGHYIPTIAAHIMKKNKESESLFISLEGIALGNPWIDPYNQYDASDIAHGLGLISAGQKYKLKQSEIICKANLKKGKYTSPVCFSLLDNIIDSSSTSGSRKVSMYDARRYYPKAESFPPGHELVENYLNRLDVKTAIHATSSPNKFVECAYPPYHALSHQDGKGVTIEMVQLLNDGLKVLIYAGQYDLICNHIGIEKMLRKLAWDKQEEWLNAQPGIWVVDKVPVGHIRSYKNLEYLLVLDAGHMVPMDQPAVALRMITAFLKQQPIQSSSSSSSSVFATGPSKIGVLRSDPTMIMSASTGVTDCNKCIEIMTESNINNNTESALRIEYNSNASTNIAMRRRSGSSRSSSSTWWPISSSYSSSLSMLPYTNRASRRPVHNKAKKQRIIGDGTLVVNTKRSASAVSISRGGEEVKDHLLEKQQQPSQVVESPETIQSFSRQLSEHKQKLFASSNAILAAPAVMNITSSTTKSSALAIHVSVYHLIIVHASPLANSVILRLRLQDRAAATTSTTHQQYHHHRHSSSSSNMTKAGNSSANNKDHDAYVLNALKDKHFEVKIEPIGREITIDTQSLLDHQGTIDLVVDELISGTDYSFTVWRVEKITTTVPAASETWNKSDATAAATVIKHPCSRRAIQVRPGCYKESMIQCCGRGECVATTTGTGTRCHCDAGYSGDFCDYYETELLGPTSASTTTTSSRIRSNVSTATTQCLTHFTPHFPSTIRGKSNAAAIASPLHSHNAGMNNSSGIKNVAIISSIHSEKKLYNRRVSNNYCDQIVDKNSNSNSSSSMIFNPRSMCCLSLEVQFQSHKFATSMKNKRYPQLLLNAFGLDIDSALYGKQSSEDSSNNFSNRITDQLMVTVDLNKRIHLDDNMFIIIAPEDYFPSAVTNQSTAAVYATISVCDYNNSTTRNYNNFSITATTAINSLLDQLSDSSSALRTGLVTSHLQPAYALVVAYRNSSHLHSLDNSNKLTVTSKSLTYSYSDRIIALIRKYVPESLIISIAASTVLTSTKASAADEKSSNDDVLLLLVVLLVIAVLSVLIVIAAIILLVFCWTMCTSKEKERRRGILQQQQQQQQQQYQSSWCSARKDHDKV